MAGVVVAKLHSFSSGISNARSSLMLTAGNFVVYSCSRRRNTTVAPRSLSSRGAGTPPSSQLSPAPSSLSSARPLTSNSSGEGTLASGLLLTFLTEWFLNPYNPGKYCQELFLYWRGGRPHIFQEGRVPSQPAVLDNKCGGSFSASLSPSGLAFIWCIF